MTVSSMSMDAAAALTVDPDPAANCTAQPNYDYQDDRRLRNAVSIAVPVLFGVIAVLGFIGNAFVIIIVLGKRAKQIRNSTNLLIVNLACADLLFIVFCVPYTAADYVFREWPFGVIWCKIVQYLIHVCAYSSVYTLVLMSVDRYLAVVHPISSMTLRTQKNTYIAIGIQWVVIMSANIPLILAHGIVKLPIHDCEQSVPCMFHYLVYDEISFRLAFLGTFFILPVTIISSLYFIMLRRLWDIRGPVGHRSNEGNRSKKRVTRMVIAVVIIFILCWSPITFILALKSLDLYPVDTVSVPVQIAAHVLAYSNVCLNPFIYAAAHPGFRSSFKNLLLCGQLRSPTHAVDFERTDMSGAETATGFIRSRSLRLSQALKRKGREGNKDSLGFSLTETTHVYSTAVPAGNHMDNGGGSEATEKTVMIKQQATRQLSKDSVF
ncbi:allatostatin-A receptor-like isoform X2 [Paramacrobiotus metropolitanus]|nr:allatostatin-A receptor-like isoform X2 [Paramacrobiotus metropolitanus]